MLNIEYILESIDESDLEIASQNVEVMKEIPASHPLKMIAYDELV